MKIPVLVSDMLYVPHVPELADMYGALRSKFEHKNPDYYKKRNQNRWTGNTPREIKTWMKVAHPDYGPCLAVPRGGSQILRKIASEFDVEISWVDKRFQGKPITHMHNDVILWREQQRLAELMFKRENCIIRSPTGSGKTETLLKVAEWILKSAGRVLIIVWEGNRKSGLFKQWVDRIRERFDLPEKEVGMFGGGIKRIAPLTVGMQQTLANVGRRLVHEFGGVICDEVQRFAAPTFQKVVGIYPARYRFGASADETRRDGKEFLIYDMFGQPAGEIERAALIDKGKIHAVTIRVIPTEFDLLYEVIGDDPISWADLPSEKKSFNELLDIMCADQDRNDLIWEHLQPCLEANHTIMIATARVDHARYFDHRIREAGYTCGLMLGGVENAEEFDTTANSLRERKINAGIGTIQKIGVGHDIPAWNRGYVLTPLAGNKQGFEQMTGRLRRPFDGKDDAALYYFWDNKLYPSHQRKLSRLYKGHVQVFVDGEFLDK